MGLGSPEDRPFARRTGALRALSRRPSTNKAPWREGALNSPFRRTGRTERGRVSPTRSWRAPVRLTAVRVGVGVLARCLDMQRLFDPPAVAVGQRDAVDAVAVLG